MTHQKGVFKGSVPRNHSDYEHCSFEWWCVNTLTIVLRSLSSSFQSHSANQSTMMHQISAIVVTVAALLVLVSGDYQCANQREAKDDSFCRWFGAGPFCDGECVWPYTENSGQYTGSGCTTGKKVYCCKQYIGEGDNCKWFGNAPFCNGVCEPPYTHQCDSNTHGDGQSCWSGQKVLCCY